MSKAPNQFRLSFLPRQWAFINSAHRYRCFSGGVRSGKTIAGCALALKLSIQTPGVVGLIGAQTYRQLTDTTAKTFFDYVCPPELIKQWNKSDNTLVLKNGSTILFRTLDDESKLRGLGLGWFYIDEGTEVKETIFKQLCYRLSESKGGQVTGFITTNPAGKGHWIYKHFGQGLTPDSVLIQTTSLDNPHLDQLYLDDLNSQQGTEWYARFVLGQWGAWSGLVYKEFDRTKHVTPLTWKPRKDYTFYRAIDWGYIDPFACLWFAETHDRQIVVFQEHYQRERLNEHHAGVIRRVLPESMVSRTYYDSARPSEAIEMRNHGLRGLVPSKKFHNSVFAGIQAVKKLLTKETPIGPLLMIHPRCHNLLTEFESYEWKPVKGDANSKEEPLDQFNHALDALRYFVITRYQGARRG